MKKITLLSLLRLKLKTALPLLALFTVINGLWSSGLFMLINNFIAGTPLPFFNEHVSFVYFLFVVLSFFFNYIFNRSMITTTIDFRNQITLEVINKLRLSNYESFLRLGEARIRTAFDDIHTLRGLPRDFLLLFNTLITIIAGMCYMFWLYPVGGLIIISLSVTFTIVYMSRNKIIRKNMIYKRQLDDTFMSYFNDFLYGFRKLKMDNNRSERIFFDYLTKNREESINHNIKSALAAFGNDLIGKYSIYIIIGVILFVIPIFFSVDKEVTSGVLVVFLFLLGPLNLLIDIMNDTVLYTVALTRINDFNNIITDNAKNSAISQSFRLNELSKFETLNFNNVGYHYYNETETETETFNLNDINLTIKRGEVIFVSGGNGSGKSTFINLLCGLFVPKSGEITYNNQLISDENRSEYRNLICSIFSNDYLFSENYDNFNLSTSNMLLSSLLNEMKLEDVVIQNNGSYKIHQNLSSGQQKRLALVYTLLEDKDFFIFDEWAAEQDPEFRKYFYENIIPDLKNRNKTVVAITHDDAYFKHCDRLIRFDYGEIINEINIE